MKIFDPKLTGSIEILNEITGDVTMSANLLVEGNLSGNITGSASTASYIELSNVDGSASLASRIFDNSSSIASLEAVSGSYANSSSFASDISTNSSSIASLEAVSGSYANSSSFASDISANSSSIASLEIVSGSYANSSSFASDISANSASIGSLNAVSSSYLLNTTDTLTGDLTVTGNIIATTLNVQDVTASVIYSSGSNIFGSSSIDTQQFTGSILTSGSIEVNGNKFTVSGATGDATFAGNVTVGNNTTNVDLYLKGGTDSNTSINFGDPSDNNVGQIIYRHASNNMSFDTNDIERMRIDSSGNVGIGEASPNEKLHVNGGTANVVANFESTDAKAYISFKDNSTTNTDTVFLGAEGNDMTFYAGSASNKRLTIDSSGNVGIGVTGTPSTKLQLGGTAPMDSIIRQDSTASGTNWEIGERSAGKWQIFEDDTDSVVATFMSTGNVGIGTDSPDTILNLNKTGGAIIRLQSGVTNTADGLYGGIEWYNTDPTTDGPEVVSNIMSYQNDANGRGGYITFGTTNGFDGVGSPTERMRIDSSGNVGIGTDSPSFRLGLSNSTALTPVYQQFTNGTTGTAASDGTVMGIDSDGDFLINNQEAKEIKLYTSDLLRLTIDSSGNATFAGNVILGDSSQIQLGTGNDAQIDHNGSHLFIDNSVGNTYLRNTSSGDIILRNSTGGDIQFDNEFAGNILFNTSNITRLTINGSGDATFAGNVGVAGKTPAYGLSLAQGTGAGNKIAWTDGTPNFRASIYANSSNDKFTIATGNASSVETTALEIDTSQNTTFSGNVTIPHNKFLKLVRSSGNLATEAIGITSGTDDVRFLTTGDFNFVNGSLTNLLNISNSGNSTFAGTSGNTNVTIKDTSGNSEVGLKLQGDAATWTLQNWGSGGDKLRVLNNAGTSMQVWEDDGSVIFGGTDINGAFGASNTILAVQGSTSGGEGIVQITGKGNNATDNVGKIDFHSYSEADPMCSIRSIRGNADDVGDLEFYTNSGGGAASKRMVITDLGDVGINEPTPTAKLQVNGKIKIGSGAGSGTDSGGYNVQVNSFTLGATGETGLLVRNDGQSGEYATIGFGYSENNRTPVVIGSIITDGGGATKGDFIVATRNTTTNTDYPTERMRIRSGGGIINQYRAAVNVGQSATAITSASTYGAIAMVWMNYAGNIGYDLVSWSLSQVTVLSSQTISGGTSSRTYTAVSGVLKLTMGGSDTYATYVSDITNSNG